MIVARARHTRKRVVAFVLIALAVIAVATVAISAMFSRSEIISLPPSASPTAPCARDDATVPVVELAQPEWTSCDMNGRDVVFPDGVSVTVTSFGGSTGLDQGPGKPRYYVENLGRYGVIAVRVDGQHKDYWGAKHGATLVKNRRSGT